MKLLKGNIIHAPALGRLKTIEDGALVLEDDGTIREVLRTAPAAFDGRVYDYSGQLIMQSFADMHLHAPQYPNVGTGMDLPLLDWLKKYTFPAEARFADPEYARRVYRKLAHDLIANGNAIANTGRQVAGGLGTALVVTLMTSVTASSLGQGMATEAATAAGTSAAYMACAAIGLVALVFGVLKIRNPKRQENVHVLEKNGVKVSE